MYRWFLQESLVPLMSSSTVWTGKLFSLLIPHYCCLLISIIDFHGSRFLHNSDCLWSFHCQWLPSIRLSVITISAKNKMIRYSSSDHGGIWDTNLVIIVCVPVPNIQFIHTEKCCSSLCRGKGTSPWICCSSFPTSALSIICFLATSVHV